MIKSNSHKVLENITSITGGRILGILLNVAWLSLAARYLGVENWGQFNFWLVVITILSKIVDLGFVPIIFREISKNRKNIELLNDAILLRLILFLIISILYNITASILDFTLTEKIISNLLLINILISAKFVNFRELLETPFKADLEMKYPIIYGLIDNIALLIGVAILPLINGDLISFAIIYTISNLPGFILLIYSLIKKYNYKLKLKFDRSKWLVFASLPIYGYVILDILYQNIDILILKNYYSDYEVGIYTTSLRLVTPLLIFPTAIIQTVFPTIVSNIKNDTKRTYKIIGIVFKIHHFIAFAVFISLIFKADEIIILLFGDSFRNSSVPLLYLLAAQIFFYYSYFSVNLYVAINKQMWNLAFSIIILVTNLGLNFLLVPDYAVLGVGIAKLGAAFLSFSAIVILNIKFFNKFFLSISKILIFTILSFFLVYLIRDINLILYFFLLTFVLLLSTILSRFFVFDELISLFRFIGKENIAIKLIELKNRFIKTR